MDLETLGACANAGQPAAARKTTRVETVIFPETTKRYIKTAQRRRLCQHHIKHDNDLLYSAAGFDQNSAETAASSKIVIITMTLVILASPRQHKTTTYYKHRRASRRKEKIKSLTASCRSASFCPAVVRRLALSSTPEQILHTTVLNKSPTSFLNPEVTVTININPRLAYKRCYGTKDSSLQSNLIMHDVTAREDA